MSRKPDWEKRLAACIKKHRETPFKWGSSDCFKMACDAHRAITGRAILTKLKGYTTEAGGYRKFKAQGFETVGQAFASVLPKGAPLTARRGDLATVEIDGVEYGGVVTDSGVLVKNGDTIASYDLSATDDDGRMIVTIYRVD